MSCFTGKSSLTGLGRVSTGTLTVCGTNWVWFSWQREGRHNGYLFNLSVTNLNQKSYAKIECEIKETGSDLPRAILAYYFAVVATIKQHGTSVMCPMVIDSPNQQDQDKMNYDGILNFIKDNKPLGSQTIMALVDDYGVDFGGDVIEMSEKNHALSEGEYEEVSSYLKSFEIAAMTSIQI